MKRLAPYSSLLIGLLLILLSYLFFNGSNLIYFTLLTIGFLISVVSFVAILYSDNLKSRIFWTIFLVSFIILKPSAKVWLIGKSFYKTVHNNQILFDQVNSILISKKGKISFPPISKSDSLFTTEEIYLINKLLKQAGVFYIRKDEDKIFYATYGNMDNDGGLFYFYSGITPTKHFGFVNGNWYFD